MCSIAVILIQTLVTLVQTTGSMDGSANIFAGKSVDQARMDKVVDKLVDDMLNRLFDTGLRTSSLKHGDSNRMTKAMSGNPARLGLSGLTSPSRSLFFSHRTSSPVLCYPSLAFYPGSTSYCPGGQLHFHRTTSRDRQVQVKSMAMPPDDAETTTSAKPAFSFTPATPEPGPPTTPYPKFENIVDDLEYRIEMEGGRSAIYRRTSVAAFLPDIPGFFRRNINRVRRFFEWLQKPANKGVRLIFILFLCFMAFAIVKAVWSAFMH
eukprot:gnl/MRDRNA2_/MRDRNA2_123513_c0_seq1.p1 gnl/MRDRNA2_/MRDRNA2_123513_c0~~gnl/MRDRNA2_/MRDRNA2_123513_c0_seq1.p1  ORF type:complete len:264 (+),score=21.47 gnl/MRDRNA2_/MRDRNA2_123513_c0_seq1:98-889(+)